MKGAYVVRTQLSTAHANSEHMTDMRNRMAVLVQHPRLVRISQRVYHRTVHRWDSRSQGLRLDDLRLLRQFEEDVIPVDVKKNRRRA